MRKSKSEYTDDWPEIANQVKEEANWCCVRCGHKHDPKNGYCLTVHHLDGKKNKNAFWNIPALCQRCHLQIQAKVIMERGWMFEHTSWFKPYVAGYYAHIQGLPTDKEYVMAHLESLLDFGRPNKEKGESEPKAKV